MDLEEIRNNLRDAQQKADRRRFVVRLSLIAAAGLLYTIFVIIPYGWQISIFMLLAIAVAVVINVVLSSSPKNWLD